jgi:uncharacterized protein
MEHISQKTSINKRKIINDPVFGFITLQSECIFDLIEHPYFQRLRRIKQLGLSHLVYPGANHTRFEHALGALGLMRSAIDVLRSKGVEISFDEAEAVSQAILLHDIGHGPFSHALEHTLVDGIHHEDLSLMLMDELNLSFDCNLDMAISIFQNQYPKQFLHQLVSSQLDMDRLDYLRRDSFYSGVIEGSVGSDRIIKMLNVKNDHLVIDIKGIYSAEKFLIARRLMYWQVYLHKTVIVAEQLLIKILQRAKELALAGFELYGPPQLQWFLRNPLVSGWQKDVRFSKTLIENFVLLDDTDIISSVKVWCNHPDRILNKLSNAVIARKLFKIVLSETPFPEQQITFVRNKAMRQFGMNSEEIPYIVFEGSISNNAYETGSSEILVLQKDNATKNIGEASDIDLYAFSKAVTKHFLCYPKELELNDFCY